MILIVTLNPLLERAYFFNNLSFPNGNRAIKKEQRAGGKGINVSRQLNRLGIENRSLIFLGGRNGKNLREILVNEKIDFSSIHTNSETRDGTVLIDNKSKVIKTYFGINSNISKSEVIEMKTRLEKMIVNCEMVVFSGSSPCKNTDSIFPFGIKIANKHNKVSVCDTYGVHLKKCIEQSPTIIHNNKKEVETTFNISLKNKNDKLDYLNYLSSNNIKQMFLTEGKKTFYSANFNYKYKVTPAQINEIDAKGSGDSFIAGIIYSWHKNFTFDESLKYASALGCINASNSETSNVKPEDVKKVKDKIKVITIGKKIKLIDDTPN